MNVMMNSTAFFILFLIVPFILLFIIIMGHVEEKGKILETVLLKKVSIEFKKFEQKKLTLSEKDNILYLSLKKESKNYTKKIKSPSMKVFVFLALISMLWYKEESENKNEIKLTKNEKELMALKSAYNKIVLIGILANSNFLKYMFEKVECLRFIKTKASTNVKNKKYIEENQEELKGAKQRINELEDVVNVCNDWFDFSFLKRKGFSSI